MSSCVGGIRDGEGSWGRNQGLRGVQATSESPLTSPDRDVKAGGDQRRMNCLSM